MKIICELWWAEAACDSTGIFETLQGNWQRDAQPGGEAEGSEFSPGLVTVNGYSLLRSSGTSNMVNLQPGLKSVSCAFSIRCAMLHELRYWQGCLGARGSNEYLWSSLCSCADEALSNLHCLQRVCCKFLTKRESRELRRLQSKACGVKVCTDAWQLGQLVPALAARASQSRW